LSIIQEALKKARGSNIKPEVTYEEKPVPPQRVIEPGPGNKSSEPKYVYYMMTGLLLVLLFGIIMIISRSSQSAGTPIPVKNARPVILPKIERREVPAEPSRKKENIGGFVLNGIMQLVDGPRAIINDIIVGEGETIRGAKVEKIKKDGVLLNYNDSEVALSINRQ